MRITAFRPCVVPEAENGGTCAGSTCDAVLSISVLAVRAAVRSMRWLSSASWAPDGVSGARTAMAGSWSQRWTTPVCRGQNVTWSRKSGPTGISVVSLFLISREVVSSGAVKTSRAPQASWQGSTVGVRVLGYTGTATAPVRKAPK